jgi:hypothetical protein
MFLLYLTFSAIQTERFILQYLRSVNYLAFLIIAYHKAVLRRFFAGFPLRVHWFDPVSGHMGFLVDKVALG